MVCGRLDFSRIKPTSGETCGSHEYFSLKMLHCSLKIIIL